MKMPASIPTLCRSVFSSILACVCASLGAAAQPSAPAPAPSPAGLGGDVPAGAVPNFRLLDHRGVSFELFRHKGARAVVLFVVGNGCPIVRHSVPELRRLRQEFEAQGVGFALLNANSHDTRAEIADEAREFEIDFPILLDPAQGVSRALGIHRTAEALLVDPQSWRIVYRGAVDDRLSYGQQKPAAGRRHLAEALGEFLQGKPVSIARNEVKGCAIAASGAWATGSPSVDYVRDVAPILRAKCAGCHAPGGVAPFSFQGYDKVRGHSATIREVLLEDRMPPWHADPHHGSFSNDASLSVEQKRTLLAWIAVGMPRGEGTDPLATAAPVPRATEWPLGKPDAVIGMPESVRLPATGVLPYQVFRIKAPLDHDVWVRGAAVRAGNAKVVHHCLIFIRYPEALRHLEPRQDEGISGFFTGFVPGAQPVFFPEGTGKFVPRGSEFVFQMHYTTTGKPETDRTELGLYFAPSKPATELVTGAAFTPEIEIPPGAASHPARAEFRFERDSLLHEVTPHMHLRGSSFAYRAEYPDGRSEVLLNVPAYDFNWQTLYRFRKPLRMPAGTRLVCTGTFDNSPANPANPDPRATVRFGEQTSDEMFIGYFNYAEVPGRP